jgi:hypothetical protein
MKARGAAIQGTLALVGLAAAYATWQRQPEKGASGDVIVLDLGRNELERVRYQDGQKLVELDRRGEGAENGLWIHLATLDSPGDAGVAVPDGGAASASSREAKVPDRDVRGNDQAEKLFDKFTPLRASRSLGVLDDAKRRELGLESSKKHLEIFARGGKHASYAVAVSALGTGAPYLQSDQDKRVFLLGSSIASDLDSAATRLVDRRLHAFKPSDYDSLVLKVDDKQRELVQISDGTQPQKLASKKTPTKPDDFARNWHDKIWHLVVTEVLGKSEVPASGEPKVAIRVDYRRRGKPVGWIEVSQPRTASSGPVPEMYARTEYTAGWVKVHAVGEDLTKEGKKIASEP